MSTSNLSTGYGSIRHHDEGDSLDEGDDNDLSTVAANSLNQSESSIQLNFPETNSDLNLERSFSAVILP